jgi:hypothetical protein
MSGIYGVPDIPLLFGLKLGGVQYASSFVSQSGAWYGRYVQVRDGNGTTQNVLMDAHLGRYPWLNDWDQSIRKKFRIAERQSVEFTWELYNTMNANTIRTWTGSSSITVGGGNGSSTGNSVNAINSSSSSYLRPDGVTPLRPSATGVLSPRIYEWGVTYRF